MPAVRWPTVSIAAVCMGCMANGEFVLTSGILGAASLRVGLRQLLPGGLQSSWKVSDDEATDFAASLVPPTPAPLVRRDELV